MARRVLVAIIALELLSSIGAAEGIWASHPRSDEQAASTDSSTTENQNKQPEQERQQVEPRTKHRMLRRILKKAEWNQLLVEISKVLVRYFLDLALKDIIGKQSGDNGTTSRKKLDAQSEVAELLREFVKSAIANI